MIDFLLEVQLNKKIIGLSDLFIKKPEISLHFSDKTLELISWGDPINDNGFKEGLQKNPKPGFIVNCLYGHYYYILLNKKNGEINIGNSMFSILPLYYYQNNEKVIFSENSIAIGEYLDFKSISRRFILETILFNYPLFNQSIFEGINLVPSNSFFNISNTGIRIVKHTKIEDYFSLSTEPWRKSVIEMRNLFLETVKKYLPYEPYVHALTGGFDGRTLVSAGLYNKKEFSCYSFGSSNSTETQIASLLTSKAGIPFINIELNDKYVRESSLDCGKEFIKKSSGTATFTRAHYLFAGKRLSEDFQYIITGNFGSEVFRAAHIAGAVISQNLFILFNSDSPEEAFKSVEGENEFRSLNKEYFNAEWESLKSDMIKLPCYNPEYKNLTKNQRFYVFVFEEIFRKYFGAEMINQFGYLKNRTPFLDINFLKAIFITRLAGIHSDFFEHNPLKRYKGQVLYAHIIRKAYPAFGKIMTDKGYKPDDLISFFGKFNIARGYLKKIIRKNFPEGDPYGVAKVWETNKDYWLNVPASIELFNLSNNRADINKEILFKILSLSYLIENNNLTPRQ
jgi:hypothetical protein